VSVGVLQAKKIVFEPALPAWKQDAIDHLQMGNMQKVIIPFKADVFPSERPNSWVLSEGDLPQAALTLARNERLPVVDDKKLVMALVIKPLGKNIAIGFFGGDWAKALEGQCEGKEKGSGKRSNSGCDSLAIAITKSALANIFGQEQINGSIQQSEIQVTRWSLDSTSFGAYSVAEPGSWEKHEILGEPVKDGIGTDRLFFAGEGTARAIYIGSYPGAYESGLKAAREIHAAMLEASGQTR
jgi:monoamine oxidase